MIVQFQGEDRKQAIINHFSLDIEEEEDFFEYMAEMGYNIDSSDELLENLHLMWFKKRENQTEYDAARAYLIKEGLDPDQLVKEGLVFIKTVQENQSLRSELQKQKDEFNDTRNNFHQINKQLMDDLVKQKELNAKLVGWIEQHVDLERYSNTTEIESLIKKSKES